MNRKTVISATKSTMRKLKVLADKKVGVKNKMVVTAKNLGPKARKIAVMVDKGDNIYKNKKTITSATDNTILKLKVLAKKKEGVRSKLVVTAKQLALLAKEKEIIRGKLEITAKKLAITAKEKEIVRRKLAITAKKLAITAEEAESVRRKLVVTAKEKEDVRSKLVVTAKKLAVTAKEAEGVRRKLAVTAKEKEDVRNKLVVTAEQLAVIAKETQLMNKELRTLDTAKDEFVSIASHQLRTPLTALKGYVGMLLDGDAGPINDKQHEYLSEIKNANDRMIGLITALLNVSRVDLGVFIVEPEQLNLKNVAEGALNDLKMKIEEKKLLVETNFEKDIPLISADLNIVRMIFQNLFTNAVKYIPPEGKINIAIKKDKQNILISVSDTGYGIPKDVQSKIFTKMFRADNARVKDPDGTGLGLYIIKSTLEKTGGKIWFESVENKGSTFYATIPLEGMKKKEGTKRLELK